MRKFLLFFVALTVCFSAYSQEISKIDPVLQEEMQVRSDEELIRVNIILQAQYDQLELRSKAAIYRLKEDKRTFVVNELKRHSRETQQEVMSYLENFARNNSVTDIMQFWIYNGITCNATKEVIEALSYLDDVLIIGFDKEENWLFDENPYPAEDTRELTYNVLKVNANLVWELGYEGDGVIVAIVDTGVNYNHNDLKTHMWQHPDYPNHGWNFVSNNNNPMDDHNHGTHCAGTVAGDGTAGSQTGMAPKAQIMAIKVWNSSGSGGSSLMCSGIQFAVEKGAHIVSMSGGVWGGGNSSERIQFRNTMINVLETGVVASIAAGNDHVYPYYQAIPNQVRVPGNCPPPWLHPDQTTTGGVSSVICVGATDANDNIANFSSWGPVTWQNISGYNDYPYNPGMGLIRPDVVAPGVAIKSCSRTNISGYMNMDGTSMATPCVAGVMALMLQKNPELTPAQICEILETTAVRLPSSTSPKGNTFGSGRIDAFEAVSKIIVCGPPISNLDFTLEYNKTVNFSWNAPGNAQDLQGYNIYVDGEFVQMVTEESYTFECAEEGTYNFCVVAVHQLGGEDCEAFSVCEDLEVRSICDPITELISNIDGNLLTLTWAAPELINEVSHYNIYKNDELLSTAETESFSDDVTTGNFIYSVEAEYVNECVSDAVSIELLLIIAPVNLEISEQSVEGIELLWEYDNEEMLFNVYRDEAKVASNIAEKQYTDTKIEIGYKYCYFVKATDEENESGASNTECSNTIGIEEFSSNLKIYPNPVNSIINIEGEQIEKITIFNSIGQIVKNVTVDKNITLIDVSTYIAGNYVLSVTFSNNSTENIKIVIQ